MAFKFIIPFCALLALVNAGAIVAPVAYAATAPVLPVLTKIVNPSVDAVASTHQNVVRSFGGTVSTYSKAIDTPYSSVRKVDSRITNNVYTPAVAKTVTYAAAPVLTKTLVAPVPTVSAYTHAAPVIAKTVYSAPSPVVYSHAATPTVVSHVAAPVVKHAIAYSPAVAVAHVAFDGFGAHWAY